MRQRRPKKLKDRLFELREYLIEDPHNFKGRWRSVFNITDSDKKNLYLEIGCGKGRFIKELATMNVNDLFIGFEGQDTIILRALEKIKDSDLGNVMLCQYYIKDFTALFERSELDGIYLNFSDPWPKKRHIKRRLTSDTYLDGYTAGLKPGGFVKMKTDNEDLFRYTVNQLRNHNKFEIIEFSEDLYRSDFVKDNIQTEYEKKFSDFKKINYIRADKK